MHDRQGYIAPQENTPPYDGEVKVLHSDARGLEYKKVADIIVKCTVSCDWVNTCDRYCEKPTMMKEMKSKAAEYGADAVIITGGTKEDHPYSFHTKTTRIRQGSYNHPFFKRQGQLSCWGE